MGFFENVLNDLLALAILGGVALAVYVRWRQISVKEVIEEFKELKK